MPPENRPEGLAFVNRVPLAAEREGTLCSPERAGPARRSPAAIVKRSPGSHSPPRNCEPLSPDADSGRPPPADGRTYGDDWRAADTAAGTMYLHRIDGRWRVAAVVRDGLTLQYGDFSAGRAATLFVRAAVADLTLKLSQVEANATLDARVFDLEIPANAVPLTLEELRRAGPLGDPR